MGLATLGLALTGVTALGTGLTTMCMMRTPTMAEAGPTAPLVRYQVAADQPVAQRAATRTTPVARPVVHSPRTFRRRRLPIARPALTARCGSPSRASSARCSAPASKRRRRHRQGRRGRGQGRAHRRPRWRGARYRVRRLQDEERLRHDLRSRGRKRQLVSGRRPHRSPDAALHPRGDGDHFTVYRVQ